MIRLPGMIISPMRNTIPLRQAAILLLQIQRKEKYRDIFITIFTHIMAFRMPEPTATPLPTSTPTPTPSPTPETDKALVVYYSAQNHTERVANYIANAANADIFELEPVNQYTSTDLNYNNSNSRVVYEHEHPEAQDIELVSTSVADWESYNTVFIGYPIWWGIAAWLVNRFITDNDFTGKTVIPFCTSASSGLGSSDTLLRDMAGTGNWLPGVRFSSGASESAVNTWFEGLNL